MDRTDVMRELGAIVRRDHWSAGFAVGWLAQDRDLESLQELLDALREAFPPNTAPAHMDAYRERWGLARPPQQ